MAITDLNYHSYFSIFTTADSDAKASNFSPFDEDHYTSNTYGYTTVSSPDVVYVPGTGKIRFRAPGDYLIIACINFSIASSDTTAVMTIEQNDSAVYTTSDLKVSSTVDPRQAVGHVIVSVSKNDSVRVRIDGGSAITAQAGSHFMVVKANGIYSNAFYATDATDQTDNDYDLFDSDEGGTITSKTSGVTYTTSNGRFTPSATRKFLTISTQHFESDVSRDDFEHRIKLGTDTNEVVDYGLNTSVDPMTHTIGYALEVADSTYIRVNNTQAGEDGDTYKIKKGTCLTMLDVSNGGTDPSAFLSISATKASNALNNTSGDIDVFDQDNYGSGTITKTDRLTATGVTYTAADGKFTANIAGKYLILLNLTVKDVTTNGNPDLKINKNGSAYYETVMHCRVQYDPLSWTACFIADLDTSDYINVIVHDLGGTLDEHGSSITMIKIDEVGGSRDVFAQQDASDSFGDDYTINTFNREVAGYQSDNLINHQIPFSRGTRGPRNLRGRTTAYAPSLGGKTKK
jgi:CYTH domain-containing protein